MQNIWYDLWTDNLALRGKVGHLVTVSLLLGDTKQKIKWLTEWLTEWLTDDVEEWWYCNSCSLVTDEVYIADISPVNSAAVLVLLVQVLQIRLHILFSRGHVFGNGFRVYCSLRGIGRAAVSAVDVCTHLLQADVIVVVHLVNDDNRFRTQKKEDEM